MRHYLGPYVPSTDPAAPGWALPAGAVTSISLTRPDGGEPGVGVIGGELSGSDYVPIDLEDVLTARARNAWLELVGNLPAGATGIDALWTAHTDGMGPLSCGPLMPTRRRILTLRYAGLLLRQREFAGPDDPHLPAIRAVLDPPLNDLRQRAKAGEILDARGEADLVAHQRKLRWHALKLGLSDEALQPAEWDPDELGIDPHTTYSDDFNRTDENPLTTPWTVRGDVTALLQGNMVRLTNDGGLIQYQSALDGDDHYSKYVIGDDNGSVSHSTSVLPGPMCRHTGTATETYWHVRMRLSDGLTQLFYVESGTFNTVLNTTGPAWATGDVIELECAGTEIGIKRNGSYVLSTPTTNANVATGVYAGVRAFTSIGQNALFDDWEAADLGGGGATVTPDGALHGHISGAPTLTQANVLAVGDAVHGHIAQAATLTQAHALVVAGALHGHLAGEAALTQAHALEALGSVHAHLAASPDLTAGDVLDVLGALHAHIAGTPALTQAHALVVAGSRHGHIAQAPELTQASQLVVQGALHAHLSGEATITEAAILDVADALHAHLSESAGITQAHLLAVQGSLHGHAAGEATLEILGLLNVAGAVHAHLSGEVTLTTDEILQALGAVHAHLSGEVIFPSHLVPTHPGMEWTLVRNRLHWTLSRSRMHWTLNRNRLH